MSDVLLTVRGGYDRWAAVYDHDANPLQAPEEPVVRAACGDVRGRADRGGRESVASQAPPSAGNRWYR